MGELTHGILGWNNPCFNTSNQEYFFDIFLGTVICALNKFLSTYEITVDVPNATDRLRHFASWQAYRDNTCTGRNASRSALLILHVSGDTRVIIINARVVTWLDTVGTRWMDPSTDHLTTLTRVASASTVSLISSVIRSCGKLKLLVNYIINYVLMSSFSKTTFMKVVYTVPVQSTMALYRFCKLTSFFNISVSVKSWSSSETMDEQQSVSRVIQFFLFHSFPLPSSLPALNLFSHLSLT